MYAATKCRNIINKKTLITPFSGDQQLYRSYALSRFPKRNAGVGRRRSPSATQAIPNDPEIFLTPKPSSNLASNVSEVLHPDDVGLSRLLFRKDKLVIERQLEMLNVFVGFEQSNKYTINTEDGESIGYIAEEPRGFLGTLSRQVFTTHRPFRAVIMDNEGIPVLWVTRPFAWINSKMFVQRLKDRSGYVPDIEPELDTFGEVQQIWHPWRRRYDLFLREPFITTSGATIEKEPDQVKESMYFQVGKVDSGFLAWNFRIAGESGNEIASIDRAFRGIGREILTDTGRYSINFEPRALMGEVSLPHIPQNQQAPFSKELNLDERALILALAVNIDFDYFSRHSYPGGGGLMHMSSWD